MKKKIFFADIDGTLLNDAKQLTPATKEMITHIMEAGHYFVICSGRPLMSVIEVGKQLGISQEHLYYIASNGGIIMEAATHKILLEKRLNYEKTKYIFECCSKAGIHCHTYTDTAIVSRKQTRELTHYQKTIHMPSLITEDIMGVLDKPPLKCIAMSLDGRYVLEGLKNSLISWTEQNQITMIFSNDMLLEMFPAQSGKGQAVLWLADLLGIPIENTLAAGDQENDISMIEAAGVGVAMLNGAEHVKAIADIVTPMSNNEDGLVPVLKEFFNL